MTRVLVCGGRDFGKEAKERWFVQDYLDIQHLDRPITHLIQGGARGVDEEAKSWAETNNLPNTEYPANWGLYGKSAGYKRNVQMLEGGKPDLVIAFPGGKGTAMMIKLAKDAGVETIIVPYEQR